MINIKGNINGIKSNITIPNITPKFSSIVLVLSLLLNYFSVFASAQYLPGPAPVVTDFGDWMMPVTETGSGASIEISVDQPDSDVYWQEVVDGKWRFRNLLRRVFDSDTCVLSPNSNGHHNFVAQHTQVNGVTGNFYICEYCGKSAGEVLEDSYDDYVSDLPATGVDSQGGLIWEPTWDDVVYSDSNNNSLLIVRHNSLDISLDSSLLYSDSNRSVVPSSSRSLTITGNFVSNNRINYFGFSNLSINVPISGLYNALPSSLFRGTVYNTSGLSYSFHYLYIDLSYNGYSGNYISLIRYARPQHNGLYVQGNRYDFQYYLPTFRITPFSGAINTTTDTTYNIDSRPTSIQGDLAYYNVQGELQLAPDVSIVNEGDSSYYNPVTDTTYDISDWSYDYSDRSYKLTLDSGDEVEVTFGDANITINEGDTSYTLHYVIQQEPTSSDPCTHDYVATILSEPTCTASGFTSYTCSLCGDSYTVRAAPLGHDYSGSVTTEATCMVSGIRTFTCNRCGDSFTEIIPALGHNWVIKSQVQTEYDTDGSLLQQGYVIYRCTNCGEEYKTLDTVYPSPPPTPTPPPSPTPTSSVPIDSDDPGFISWILALAKWVFGSFDGDALKEWFNWFDSDTSDLDYDFWSG